MITKLSLIRNVSQFESVTVGSQLPLSRLALVYAENGRGKTTLAAIFKSLGTGDPMPIVERQRITAQYPPHIRIDHSNGIAQFQNGAWDTPLESIAVYDDSFVDENIYSGLSVDSDHRHNLHELILGSQGVSLNQQLRTEVDKIEEHNRALRSKASLIGVDKRGAYSIEEFCKLTPNTQINEAIRETESNLAAAKQQDKISRAEKLEKIQIPTLDIESITSILKKGLPDLEQEAVTKVQTHLQSIGSGGEAWVADGVKRLNDNSTCPFCMHSLNDSNIIQHYKSYFSNNYKKLKQDIEMIIATLNRLHGGEARAAFERSVRLLSDQQQFWSKFIDAPSITLNTVEISKQWRAIFEVLIQVLEKKKASPLEAMDLSNDTRSAIRSFSDALNSISDLNQMLMKANQEIALVKESAQAKNIQALEADLKKFNATKIRYQPEIETACKEYEVEAAAKAQTEQRRDTIREALNQHQKIVFPTFNTAINDYLRKFNANFRLNNIAPEHSRAGTACTYDVVIYDRSVTIGGSRAQSGQPDFKNTLSSGDRNTLALAFFFAMVDQDSNLENKVVVIDDPMTSLDDHRTLTTVQEIRSLSQRVKQVIVLSHNKPFLCRIWEHSVPSNKFAIQITRDGSGSTFTKWNVKEDSITEYDRKHELLRDYLRNNSKSREVAQAIRPVLEGFLRVSCPEHFPPNTLIGQFLITCDQHKDSEREVLDQSDIAELQNLKEFANKFHHDTNPAWQTESINDGELLGFTERTLKFIRRR